MRATKTSLLRGTAAETAIANVCGAGLDATALRRRLREPLSSLLRFDGYCVNTCDASNGAVTSSVGDGLPPKSARRLFELEARGGDFHSLSALFSATHAVVRLSEATGGDVSRSGRMREVLAPLGFVDELRAALRSRGACWGYLHLLRKRSAFTDLDVERVRRVAPLIGDGLRLATTGPAEAILSPPTVVLLKGDAAEALGGTASLDALDSGADVPHAARAVGELARLRGSASSLTRGADGRWLKLTAVKRGSGAAVVIAPAAEDEALEVSFTAAGLTARERDVARLMARGASNDGIASSLAITRHTVKDHVKAVLRKTGSQGRRRRAGALIGARVR